MPFCRGCGAEFTPGASFCRGCGQATPQNITPAVVGSTQNTEPQVTVVQQMAPRALNQMAAGPLLLSKQIPEKEYVVTDQCFPFVTCGGSQKLKFHADEIELEEHVVCPWLVFINPYIAGPILSLFCINLRSHKRVPYTKITSVEYDKTGCGCWQFHIFGGHGSCAALTQSPWICGCPIQPTDQGNAEAIITDIVETINNKKRERAN